MPVVKPGVIREKIIVSGNVTHVFDFISDFSNAPLWDPGVVRSTPEKGFDKLMVSLGTSYKLNVIFKGKIIEMEYYIAKFDPPNEVVLKGESEMIYAIDTIKFKQLENNLVEINYEADLSLKSWRRPFIIFLNTSLNYLGKSAKEGIENYYKYGDKHKKLT